MMSQLVLDRNARLLLQAKAHHLDPVVLLGGNGLTEAVIKEVDRALTAHGLIKAFSQTYIITFGTYLAVFDGRQ